MTAKKTDLLARNSIFGWIALATGFILSIPFVAMQQRWAIPDPGSSMMDGVNWTLFDFIVMGTLLFGTGSTFVLLARKVDKKYRLPLAVACVLGFLWLWAELAVGIFTNWGS